MRFISSETLEKITGIKKEEREEYLGIYIGLDYIFIAEATNKNGILDVMSLVKIPVKNVNRNNLRSSEMNRSFFDDETVWLEPLRKVFSEKKFRKKKAVVSLSADFCIFRHFVMPYVERKFWRQSIPLQAKKYLHFPFEQGIYSYGTFEYETKVSKQKKLEVLFGITDKRIAESVRKGLKAVGITVVGIEPSICSVSRLLKFKDKEVDPSQGRIYTYFTGDKGSFIFINKSAPLLQKDIVFSGMYTTERRKLEVTSYIDFITNQLEKNPFEETVLLGRDKKVWGPLLESAISKPVRVLNIHEVMGFESKHIGDIASVGSCFKFSEIFHINLDLTGQNQSVELENKALYFIWKMIGLAVLIILLFAGYMQIKSFIIGKQLDRQIRRVQKSNVVLDEFRGKSAKQIKQEIEDRDQEDIIMQKIFRSPKLTSKMVALAKITPKEVWIDKLEYKDDVFVSENKISKNRKLDIDGFILSKEGRKRELEIGDKYKEDFVQDEELKKICSPSTEIKYKIPETEKGKSERETATNFFLSCK